MQLIENNYKPRKLIFATIKRQLQNSVVNVLGITDPTFYLNSQEKKSMIEGTETKANEVEAIDECPTIPEGVKIIFNKKVNAKFGRCSKCGLALKANGLHRLRRNTKIKKSSPKND